MDIRKIDALSLLCSIERKSVDMILTDPPYYKLLKVEWDNQWKTKEEYLEWLEGIIKECKRVLKDNGSFYMFCSSSMLLDVGCVVKKHFNVLNTIRWCNTGSMSYRCCREELRQYLNPSEEIIFAEHSCQYELYKRDELFRPIKQYLNTQREKAQLSMYDCKGILNTHMAHHYFKHPTQWLLPTEEHYNKLKQYMDLKPYKEIKAEYDTLKEQYESLRRPFHLTADKPYNNTWHFKQTPTKKGRHPCEKPYDLIKHIIEVSSNEGDLIVDMFCGSCVVPKVCRDLKRTCIAGDVDDKYF